MESHNNQRLVAALLGSLVLCFIATTGYVQLRARAIDKAAYDISENAAPSILYLAAARSEVRNLQSLLEHELDASLAENSQVHAEVAASRARIHRDVQRYQILPVFVGERALWNHVNRELSLFDDSVERCLASIAAHHMEDAKRLAHTEMRQAVGRAVDAFMDVIEFDARQAHDRALLVSNLRVALTRSVWVLNGLCLLCTIAVFALFRNAIARQSRVREAQHKLAVERADELEQFAGRVAHDILNPLSVVSYVLRTLDQVLTEEQRTVLLARGRKSIQRMQQILDGLLQFARAGAHPEPGARADVSTILAELGAELHAEAAEAGIELKVAPLEPCVVTCSPGILISLLQNLVHNAIKYIGDGVERRITIRALVRDATVRLEVEDTGPGLPPELEKKVFDPYVRAPRSSQPGIGLGLATVKRAAEAHGGRVGVRSHIGRGCLFWFELPKAAERS